MQERHKDRKRYFNEQVFTTEKYVIPYIKADVALSSTTRILEIGCGEGGNMLPFLNAGCEVTGVDLNEKQLELAQEFLSGQVDSKRIHLLFKDIYLVDPSTLGLFDLIIMRDVIEHIHNQEKFMNYVKIFLKPEGKIFFGFPPWRMPFGGHQQICNSIILSKTPYFHLLPAPLYRFVLKLFGEANGTVEALLEIKNTGISIARFEKILRQEKFRTIKKTQYFINPNYEIKFGLKPKHINPLVGQLPFFKDFFITCCYFLVGKNDN